MAEQFDPYLHWLGIRDPQRPPNYYRLLGIELFESDPEVISNAADRQMAHVRTFQTGKHSALSQKILNELAAAKICLLNPEKKAQYDAQLLAQQAAQQLMPPLTVAAPPGQPGPAGLWPLHPPAMPAPVAEPPPAEPSSISPPAVSSWFSVIATVLVAVILVLIGLIVAVSVKRSAGPSAAVPPVGPQEEPPEGNSESTPSPEGKPWSKAREPKKFPLPEEKPKLPPKEVKPPKPPESLPLPPASESLRAVRQALVQRDLEAARKHLELANRAAPMGSPVAQEVARLHIVCTELEEFWKAVAEALQELRPGKQFVFGPFQQQAVVKAVSKDSFRIEIEGNEQTFTLKTMPIDLARALVESRLLRRAEGAVTLAAPLIFDPQGDLAQAERLIQDALAKQIPHAEQLAEELKLARSARLTSTVPSLPPTKETPGQPTPSPKETPSEKPETSKPESLPKSEPPKPPDKPPEEPSKPARLPIPAPEAQQKALAQIRELFERDYKAAQKPEEKSKLAETLYKLGTETRDNPAAQYMLFVEARNLALESGNKHILDRSLRKIAQNFEVDLAELSAAVFEEAAKRSRPTTANQAAAQVAADLASEAFARDKLPEAIRLAQAARELAGKASDTLTVKRAAALRRRYEDFLPRYEAFLKAGQTLQSNPDDPDANLAYGFYLCFAKQEWPAGLRHLSKANDPVLKALADAELKLIGARDISGMVAVGDKWWEAAASISNETTREAYRARAAYWYRQAQPYLSGLTKTRVERRLQELNQ
jgi:hypothetical protein